MASAEVIVKIVKRNITITKKVGEAGLKIEDLLRELGINPISVVVFKNGVIVTEDDLAKPGDVIEVYAVSPGG